MIVYDKFGYVKFVLNYLIGNFVVELMHPTHLDALNFRLAFGTLPNTGFLHQISLNIMNKVLSYKGDFFHSFL